MGTQVVGIDLGGTSIKAGLVDEEGHILAEETGPTSAHEGVDRVLDRITDIARSLMSSGDRVGGIGIGTPGAVGLDRDTVSEPPNFTGWTHVRVGSRIAERLDIGLPVIVENDCNAAALGSNRYGAGKSFDSFIMITLGTGVGGAIIHNGRLFRGVTGAAGEIGHMTIDHAGPPANSGVPGALEAYIGQRFLSAHAQAVLANRPDSLVHRLTVDGVVTPLVLFDAATQGDAAAIELLSWAGHKLGCGLGSAVNLLDIRKIVVGGGLSSAGDFLLEPARKSLIQFVTPALRDGLEIVRETRGNEAGILGAADLVFQHLDEHRPDTG